MCPVLVRGGGGGRGTGGGAAVDGGEGDVQVRPHVPFRGRVGPPHRAVQDPCGHKKGRGTRGAGVGRRGNQQPGKRRGAAGARRS